MQGFGSIGNKPAASFLSPATSTATSTQKKQILERPLPKLPNLSLTTFHFLFSSIVQYSLNTKQVSEVEAKLGEIGYRLGQRISELIPRKREKLVNTLMFINNTVWKYLFNKAADSLEKSRESDDEYMIVDNEPVFTRFIGVPKDLSQLNCNAFVAGVIEAILEGKFLVGFILGGFFKVKVSAHSTPTQEYLNKVTFLVKVYP